jgi:hypothetical protein
MRLAEELRAALATDDLVCIEADEDLAHALEEAAKGEKEAGHKYVRREGPFLTKGGKKRYRYFYKTSAVARAARAGAEVRLGKRMGKIEAVAPNGNVTLSMDGASRTVTPDQWANLLQRHYGKGYSASAEKRAHQAINAVLKHVPRDMLKDLKGSTDEARLKDLQKRMPEVYGRLQGSFKRAGMDPFQAKQVLARTLKRRGWEPEARAAVIGSVMTGKDRNYRQTISASENLAGGGKVEARHVAAVVELRNPPKGFASDVAATGASAEKELAKLSEAISAAQKSGNPEEAAFALSQALNSPAMQKLNMMAQAFPGLRDKAIQPSRDTMAKAVSVAPIMIPKTKGAATSVYVAGEGGQPKALNARYRLMEADDLIPSHDSRTFGKNKKYPEGIQERVYHRDKAEQAKVTRNAQRMIPQLLVNTNPDAVNGPPLVRKDGVVLGGNSRVMSMQLASRDYKEKSADMKKYLAKHAHEVGFRPEDVGAMKNPILVREVENPGESKEDLRRTVRQMNESFTQGMDPRTMQVAMGHKLTDATMETLGDDMKEDETLNEFLASGRSERFVNSLHKAGVIDQRNASQYLQKGTKKLNQDGRVLVSRILTGRMVGDADMLSETRPKMVDNIARSVPFVERAKSHGEKYNLSDDIRVALDAYNDLTRQVDQGTIPALDSKMRDRTFNILLGNFRQLPGIGETHPVVDNDRARTLLEVMIRKPGPAQMSKVFRDYAKQAGQYPEGQAGLFGGGPTPETMLRNAAFGPQEKPPSMPLAAWRRQARWGSQVLS